MICGQCHQSIIFHAIVDSEDWEKIAREDYALCPVCMNKRFAELGVTVECEIWYGGTAMSTKWSGRAKRAGAWRQPEEIEIQRSVGLPSLYRNLAEVKDG